MAVALLTSLRTIEVRPYEPDPPGPGEVQVRVAAVGVCGSDLHNFREGSVGGMPCVYPMVLGHEPTGVVSAVGAGVTQWSPGDRVALEAPLYCYHCEFCMSGRHNLCHHVRFLSNAGEPGFFRDHVNLPPVNLLPLPEGLGMAEGTLFEPIAIALQSFRFGQPRLGETAAVLGAGPIGLVTIACLRLAGVARIWAVEPVAHRRELARIAGADASIDPSQTDPVREVLRETGQRGVDMVFDCAGKGDSHNQAIHMGAPAARIVITALPSEERLPIDFHTLRRKEQWFFPVRRSNHRSELALRLLAEHAPLFAPMVTHRWPLERAQEAFETLESYAGGVGKIVLLP
jgi:L-iditol 2-dehydrogenase